MPMFTTAMIAAALVTAGAPPAAATGGAYDAVTAGYNSATGQYCIRSGWASVGWHTGRVVRAGDCGTAAAWRRRGVEFDASMLAQRQPNAAVAER